MHSLSRTLAKLSHDAAFLQGLAVCGLLQDIDDLRCATLLVPCAAAFRSLPHPFRRFLVDDDLTEQLFDMMELAVIPGVHVRQPQTGLATLHGATLSFGAGAFTHGQSTARVLETLESDRVLIHVTDRWLFPLHTDSSIEAPAGSLARASVLPDRRGRFVA
jgi:hypothetical protein